MLTGAGLIIHKLKIYKWSLSAPWSNNKTYPNIVGSLSDSQKNSMTLRYGIKKIAIAFWLA